MPPDMCEWLPAEHLVWFVLDMVEQLDTQVFHRRHLQAGPGRAAYDPDMLLGLLLYAYAVGERSSRRIETLCATDVAFRVVCAQDAPDHSTIARFRAAHEDAFAGLFTQVLLLCARAGMGRVGTVAVDGTKIAANASAGATRTEVWLRAQAEQIVAEAAQVDAGEDEQFGEARGDELPPELADPHTRAARIRQCLDQIEAASKQAQEADDAERARAEDYLQRLEAGEALRGRPPRGSDPVRVACARLAREQARLENAQTDLARRNADRGIHRARADLRKAHKRAEEATPAATAGGSNDSGRGDGGGSTKQPRANVTDPDSRTMPTRNGWVQGYNAQLVVSDDHLILATGLTQDTGDVSSFEPMMNAAVEAAGAVQKQHPTSVGDHQRPTAIGTLLADAGYLSWHNLTLDGPDRLIALGKNHDLHRQAKDNPATGPPPEHADAMTQMGHRLRTPQGQHTYRRRGATAETVIAHLKDQIGLRRFSRRGIDAVTSELNLSAAVVNLLRLHANPTARAT
jgi:transposase